MQGERTRMCRVRQLSGERRRVLLDRTDTAACERSWGASDTDPGVRTRSDARKSQLLRRFWLTSSIDRGPCQPTLLGDWRDCDERTHRVVPNPPLDGRKAAIRHEGGFFRFFGSDWRWKLRSGTSVPDRSGEETATHICIDAETHA